MAAGSYDSSEAGALAGLSRLALALLDFLAGSRLARASVDVRRQARMTVGINLLIAMMGGAILTVAPATTESPLGNLLLVFVISTAALGILALRLGVSPRLAGHCIPAIIFVPCLISILGSVGDAIGAMVTLLLVPVIGVVVAGRAGGLVWTGVVWLTLGITAYMDSAEVPALYPRGAISWPQIRFPLLAAEAGLMATLAMVFEWLRGRALAEASASRNALATSEARYRALAENAGDIVTEFDERMRYTFISPNCFEVSGWTPEELQGQSFTALVHPDDQQTVMEQVQEQGTRDSVIQLHFRLHHRAGHWLEIESSTKPYINDKGELRIVGISRDITELMQAQRAIRRSERLASVGTLAAGVAHQINNPIGSILAAAEYASLSLEDQDQAALDNTLHDIAEQARRCGDIVRSLLQFARDEDSTRVVQDLTNVIHRATSLTSTYATERGVELKFEQNEPPLQVEISPVEIEQVLINVLRNAVESQPRSGRVHVRLHKVASLARIEVEDDGAGIEADAVARIFDPFFTTRLRDGGSGLGLSVAHGIIEDHGGQICVDSEHGKGTRIRIELPLAAPR